MVAIVNHIDHATLANVWIAKMPYFPKITIELSPEFHSLHVKCPDHALKYIPSLNVVTPAILAWKNGRGCDRLKP